MEQIITQNQNLKLKLIFKDNNFRFVNSGKLGLSLVLDYLKKFHNFNLKNDEVFVPKYMGQWIYSSLNQKSITSPAFTKKTKVIYMYHQFGVPQKINLIKKFSQENKTILIEDCAHVIGGNFDDNINIGQVGDFTIFSFSKFIDCYLLGGIYSKDINFINYIDKTINASSKLQSLFNYFSLKLAYFLNEESLIRKKIFNINYSLYNFPSKHLNFIEKNFNKYIFKEINLRIKRFNFLKQISFKFEKMDFLKYDNLILYKLPLIVDAKDKENLKKIFNKLNFKYELLQYDTNRNMLEPNYQETIVIEIGSKNLDFEKQIEIAIKELYEK